MKKDLPQVFLIIDGHNLAYLLFDLPPGQRLSPALAGRLAGFLSAYRREFPEPRPEIELCFDGGVRPAEPDPEGVRILAAGHHNLADNLVLDRFRVHQFFGQPCLAISNDLEVLERVKQEGGIGLKAFDLVMLRHAEHPLFLAPPEVIAKIPIPTAKKPRNARGEVSLDAVWRVKPLKPGRTRRSGQPFDIRIAERNNVGATGGRPGVNPDVKSEIYPPELTPQSNPGRPAVAPTPEWINPVSGMIPASPTPRYTLTLSTWPVSAAVKFLTRAFCPRHRPEFLDLLAAFDPAHLRPADLAVLVDFLRERCAAEPGFVQRGSLMDRTRLALLKDGPDGLSLAQLAAETGLPLKGLQGRIKRKAEGWVEIQ